MRGSIRTKIAGKTYELRVALGKDPITGRYRQKSITVRGSRADAQRALRRLLDEVETGKHQPDGGSRTFGELLDDWLAFKIAADRSPTTIDRYRGVIVGSVQAAGLVIAALDHANSTLRFESKGVTSTSWSGDETTVLVTADGDGSRATFNSKGKPSGALRLQKSVNARTWVWRLVPGFGALWQGPKKRPSSSQDV